MPGDLRSCRLTDRQRSNISRLVADLETFKSSEHNQAIIPSLRLFAVGHREFADLLSKNRGDVVASMASVHLVNRRSFEALEERIDQRAALLETDDCDAIVLEVTVDRKARLNRFYWITCSPDSRRGLGLNYFMTLASCMKQGRTYEQARLQADSVAFDQSLEEAGMTASLLINVSAKTEDFTANMETLRLISVTDYESTDRDMSKRDLNEGRYSQHKPTERIFGDHRGRPEDANTIEARMNRLVSTYRRAGFERDDRSSETDAEIYHEESKKNSKATGEVARSLKALRTQRKMQIAEDLAEQVEVDARREWPSKEIRGVSNHQ